MKLLNNSKSRVYHREDKTEGAQAHAGKTFTVSDELGLYLKKLYPKTMETLDDAKKTFADPAKAIEKPGPEESARVAAEAAAREKSIKDAADAELKAAQDEIDRLNHEAAEKEKADAETKRQLREAQDKLKEMAEAAEAALAAEAADRGMTIEDLKAQKELEAEEASKKKKGRAAR